MDIFDQVLKSNMQVQLDRIESKLDELLARKKRVVKPKGSKDGYHPWFNEVWEAYPKRSGSNPKGKASSALDRRLEENPNLRYEILEHVVRYSKFCDATGKTGTEYVMQAATFFGPDKHYENDWAIPAQKVKVPADNDEMLKWAIAQGMRQPREGESWTDYRRYVTQKVTE